jgi:hypothetical protein
VTPSLLNFSVVLRQDIVQKFNPSSTQSSAQFPSLHSPSSETQCPVTFLLELMKLYEKGKPTEFFNFFDSNQEILQKDNLLKTSSELLVRKIRVVSLCDSIFFSQKNSNRISFKEISEIVGVPVDDVELLVIHVLSIKLISGHIDEVNEQLVIESIKPRELDDQRLVQLKNKYVNWQSSISGSLEFIKNC